MTDASLVPRRRHWEMLIISCAVIVGALVLRVDDDREHVVLSGPWTVPLPPSCVSREVFGVPCPGCGLTRSFVYLAHGRFQDSWHAHHIGWLMALATIVQIPYRCWCLRRSDRQILPIRVVKSFGTLLIALLFINWALDRILAF